MLHQPPLFHPVTPFDRGSYLVQSATRGEVEHLVDLEGDGINPIVCTCEAFILGGEKLCPHIKSVGLYL